MGRWKKEDSPLLSEPGMSAHAWNRKSRRLSSVQESRLESGSRQSLPPLLYENLKGPAKGHATGGVSTGGVTRSRQSVSCIRSSGRANNGRTSHGDKMEGGISGKQGTNVLITSTRDTVP